MNYYFCGICNRFYLREGNQKVIHSVCNDKNVYSELKLITQAEYKALVKYKIVKEIKKDGKQRIYQPKC
jgi:dsRNA-specific ribonuclease